MQNVVCSELIDCGVDWLTVTTPEKSAGSRMAQRATRLLREEVKNGNPQRPWSMSGYRGWSAGSISTGERKEDLIVRIGGDLARCHWREFYELSANCSRIDVQVTAREGQEAPVVLRREFQKAKRYMAQQGNPSAVSFFFGGLGGNTLYLGRRSSDVFGRVYDKFAQAQVERYRAALRWEVEFKGDKARSIASQLFASQNESVSSVHIVSTFFRGRGCSARSLLHLHGVVLPDGIQRMTPTIRLERSLASENARKLVWLQDCVRPTITRLIDQGLGQAVWYAVGMDHWSQVRSSKPDAVGLERREG